MKNFPLSVTARKGHWSVVLLLSVLLGVLWTHVSLAQGALATDAHPTAGATQIANRIFRVWAFNPTAQRSQLRVVAKDEEDRVLYEQHGSDTSFGRKLDVHELPDGRYSILLKVGRTQHRFELVLHSTRQHLAKISSY